MELLFSIEPKIRNKRRRPLRELRKLGGEWKAIRLGFNWWEYEGDLLGHHYEIARHSYLASRWSGDDDHFISLWTVKRDGEILGCPTHFPVDLIRQSLKR